MSLDGQECPSYKWHAKSSQSLTLLARQLYNSTHYLNTFLTVGDLVHDGRKIGTN